MCRELRLLEVGRNNIIVFLVQFITDYSPTTEHYTINYI